MYTRPPTPPYFHSYAVLLPPTFFLCFAVTPIDLALLISRTLEQHIPPFYAPWYRAPECVFVGLVGKLIGLLPFASLNSCFGSRWLSIRTWWQPHRSRKQHVRSPLQSSKTYLRKLLPASTSNSTLRIPQRNVSNREWRWQQRGRGWDTVVE